MAKKVLSVLLSVALLLCVVPLGTLPVSASDDGWTPDLGKKPTDSTESLVDESVYTYTVSNGEATVTGYTGAGGDVVIPDRLGGYPVTSIGDDAFSGCSSLTSVTIGNGVTSIGYRAFYNCSSLTSVTIGNGVTSIGNYAFYNCSSLTSITIPDSVTSIGDNAFSDCSSLTSIDVDENNLVYHSAGNCLIQTENKVLIIGCQSSVIPADGSVTSIWDSAFLGCSRLTSITIPDCVTSIGYDAFYNCSSLTSVTIGSGVTSIGSWAFCNCSSLTSIDVDENNLVYHSAGNCVIRTEEKVLVIGCQSSVIPADGSVTSVGEHAFFGCSSLTSITIPDSVTSIGRWAFEGCSSLTSITIPDGVTSIGSDAFCFCSSLTSVTIGNGVTSIGDHAFYGCSSLTSITIPDGVTSIGDFAFDYCDSLTSVTIGNGVTSIGSAAFYNCSSLTSVTIPDSVTSIGGSAFYGCSSLTDVWYTGSETDKAAITIGSDNTALTSATWHYNTCAAEHTYGGDCDATCNFCEWVRTAPSDVHTYENDRDTTCMLCGSVRSYIYTVSSGEVTIIGYLGEGGDVVIPSTLGGYPVTGIDGSAFECCNNLTSVTIPDGVTSIGTWVFSACKNLTSVTIPEGVASIGYATFTGCESLTAITIPNTVTNIEDWAFEGCSSLTSITIPDSVTSIGYAAFYECSSLTSVTIGSGVTSIGAYAFNNCDSLTSITIPDSVTSIEIGAFAYCSSLASVTIPDSVTSVVDGAFYDCNNLSDVWYGGSESQKDAIAIGDSNENLTSATWHYAEPDEPTITEILVHPDVSNGVKLLVLYSDGTTQEVTDGYTIDGFDPMVAGEQQLSITYMDFTQGYTVTFDKPPIEAQTVLIDPDVSNGINLTIVYADGTTQPIATGYTFDDFDPTAMGEQTLTLAYYGITKDILVKAQDPADVIEYISGDVNGDGKINNKDLGLLLQYLNNWDVEVVELACDVNRDDKINNKDLGILLQYLNGWEVELK